MRDPMGGYRADDVRARRRRARALHDEFEAKERRWERRAKAGLVAVALFWAAFYAGLAFVAWHFLSRWW